MRTKLCAFVALAVLAVVAVSGASAKPPAANLTFKTFDVPSAVYTDVLGINNLGVTVGQYATSDFAYHGFIAWGGHITTVDVPGAVGTGIESINDLGTAVGWWWGSDNALHGFIRSWSGAIKTIDDPNATPSVGTLAYGINDLGVVVGYYLTTLNNGADCCGVHGFLYKNGKFSNLDVPGYDDTVVMGINNVGGITGYTAHHNDVSWLGFTGLTGGGYRVFTAAGDNGGDNGGTFPSAINDWGTVVGHANGWENYGVFVGWERLANGQMVTISDPLANTTPDPSWGPECYCFGGTVPGGINDLGTVVGVYFDNSGYGQGFIATPTR